MFKNETNASWDFGNVKENNNSSIQNKSNNQKLKIVKKNYLENCNNTTTNNFYNYLDQNFQNTQLKFRLKEIRKIIDDCSRCQKLKQLKLDDLILKKPVLQLLKGWENSKEQNEYYLLKNEIEIITCEKHFNELEEYKWIMDNLN